MSQVVGFKELVIRVDQADRRKLLYKQLKDKQYTVLKTFERNINTIGATQTDIMVSTENGHFVSGDPEKQWLKGSW